MKNSRDKKYLLVVNTFMQVVFCFFTVFFGVYVYDISQDFNIVMLYTLTYVLTVPILFSIIRKFITRKMLSVLYMLSFVLCLCCTVLSFFISQERIWLVFVIQFLYATTCTFYYMPSELGAMYKNHKGDMKKFNGLNSFVAVFSAVLSPILSGYLIDFVSIYVLFGIMGGCVVISFIFASKIKLTNQEVEHVKLKEFFTLIRKDKGVRYGYIGYALKRFSQDGPLDRILPILLFLRTGQNYGVGIYSAIAALVAGVALLVYVYLCKNSKIAMWLCSAFQMIASILLLVSGSVVCFFIYYFVKNITYKLITNDMVTSVFVLVNHTPLHKHKVEHYYLISTSCNLSLVISCVLGIIIYNCLNDVISMSILIAIFSAILLLSTFFVTKSDDMLKNQLDLDCVQMDENECENKTEQ